MNTVTLVNGGHPPGSREWKAWENVWGSSYATNYIIAEFTAPLGAPLIEGGWDSPSITTAVLTAMHLHDIGVPVPVPYGENPEAQYAEHMRAFANPDGPLWSLIHPDVQSRLILAAALT